MIKLPNGKVCNTLAEQVGYVSKQYEYLRKLLEESSDEKLANLVVHIPDGWQDEDPVPEDIFEAIKNGALLICQDAFDLDGNLSHRFLWTLWEFDTDTWDFMLAFPLAYSTNETLEVEAINLQYQFLQIYIDSDNVPKYRFRTSNFADPYIAAQTIIDNFLQISEFNSFKPGAIPDMTTLSAAAEHLPASALQIGTGKYAFLGSPLWFEQVSADLSDVSVTDTTFSSKFYSGTLNPLTDSQRTALLSLMDAAARKGCIQFTTSVYTLTKAIIYNNYRILSFGAGEIVIEYNSVTDTYTFTENI